LGGFVEQLEPADVPRIQTASISER
jgi:hypothetical protein